jgi:hypothetical protein
VQELAAAGIAVDRLPAPHLAELDTLADDELGTVIRLKRLPADVANEDEIDARPWWGGSIF